MGRTLNRHGIFVAVLVALPLVLAGCSNSGAAQPAAASTAPQAPSEALAQDDASPSETQDTGGETASAATGSTTAAEAGDCFYRPEDGLPAQDAPENELVDASAERAWVIAANALLPLPDGYVATRGFDHEDDGPIRFQTVVDGSDRHWCIEVNGYQAEFIRAGDILYWRVPAPVWNADSLRYLLNGLVQYVPGAADGEGWKSVECVDEVAVYVCDFDESLRDWSEFQGALQIRDDAITYPSVYGDEFGQVNGASVRILYVDEFVGGNGALAGESTEPGVWAFSTHGDPVPVEWTQQDASRLGWGTSSTPFMLRFWGDPPPINLPDAVRLQPASE